MCRQAEMISFLALGYSSKQEFKLNTKQNLYDFFSPQERHPSLAAWGKALSMDSLGAWVKAVSMDSLAIFIFVFTLCLT